LDPGSGCGNCRRSLGCSETINLSGMPLDLSRIKALCFDVDGTLNDTDDQFVLKLSRWLQLVRFIFPDRDPKPFSRRLVMMTETPATYLYGLPDRLGVDDKLAAVGDFIYRLGLGKNPGSFSLIGGAHAALEKLKPHYPMSLVSARGDRNVRRFIEQFNLDTFFVCAASAQTCRHTKPYPDPILWAAEKMGYSPAECLMIGDTVVDILAGKAAGTQTIGLLCGFGEEAELRKAGADEILASVADLPGVMLRDGSRPVG
jgi:phosphoglycolate phosphatase-like HAD superfamily hydrolase